MSTTSAPQHSPAHAGGGNSSGSGGVSINALRALNEQFQHTEREIRMGGGLKAIDRQHEKGRLAARERIEKLLDDPKAFTEFGIWAAHGMYAEHGGAPAAGVVTGVGAVAGANCMIIANDATVKAGAFFPMTCKKIIRAQMIAQMARLPLLYLVDSAGVFLPLQEDVFPDTDDFGRIFRNNAVISAEGITQIAAIMGYCVAGGGYLPVLCDTLLMTEGSGLYLAGPALVKAAIGQNVTDEELGGAKMHASISGTIDFREKDDESCIARLRALMEKNHAAAMKTSDAGKQPAGTFDPDRSPDDVYSIFSDKPGAQYDTRQIIRCVVDKGGFDEYKAEYGMSIVCGYAMVEGQPCGIVANHKQVSKPAAGGMQLGGVIYHDSADKAARFIMDCNQKKIPIVFLHDTTGFMVGRESEQHGIIRAGAKMVNAMSNTVTPKIVVILGGSYGAGNYAMCGRAFDPFVSYAWPSAKCAVMGAAQASGTLAMIEEKSRERKGEKIDEETHKAILAAVRDSYNEQQDIRHGAARGWIDRIIQPHETRKEIATALRMAAGWDYSRAFKTGVLQT
ncbi:MAG TPA: acyl-CoA carboxylase subunit beta [Phycisphaerales bacterium]|nr:acyl-CoA carboxylase subunit beta [Phycisphaerales bacterium]